MGLSPKEFWSLSPAEWRWLCAAVAPREGAAMTRRELAALAARYPDENPKKPVRPSPGANAGGGGQSGLAAHENDGETS